MIRMTYENNEKYIAELWIEDGEDEEYKKSFLKSLVEQWQGHEHGFDSDTLDGHHYSEISNEITEKTENLMHEFKIGYTIFTKNFNEYFLGFDAIKLYNMDFDGPTDEEKTLPWETEPRDQNNIPTLLEVFGDLYSKLYLVMEGDEEYEQGGTNRKIYQRIKERLLYCEQAINTITELFAGRINEEGKLNADTVNGIRFYIYTEEQYAARKTLADAYEAGTNTSNEAENAYNLLNNIHNFFIIKTTQELVDGGYDGGVYDFNPDTNIIDKYYKFRIADVSEDDTTKRYLQYRHEDGAYWQNLCETKDLIDSNIIKTNVIPVLTDNTQYTLNSTSLERSLNAININNRFLKGGVYKENYEQNADYISLPIITDNGKYLDLTDFRQLLEGEMEDVSSDLIDRIADNNNSLRSEVNNAISQNNTAQATTLNNLKSQISQLQSSINTLNTNLSNISKWNYYYMPYLNHDGIQNYNAYNPSLKIGVFRFYFQHYHKIENNGKWVSLYKEPDTKYQKDENSEEGAFVYAIPAATVVSPAFNNSNINKIGQQILVTLKPKDPTHNIGDGEIYINVTSNNSTNHYVTVSGLITYFYKNLKS